MYEFRIWRQRLSTLFIMMKRHLLALSSARLDSEASSISITSGIGNRKSVARAADTIFAKSNEKAALQALEEAASELL